MTRFRPLLPSLILLLVVGVLALWFRPAPPAPIRVGVLHSLSGTLAASERPLVDALHLAAEEINAAGGLLGRPIELLVADGRSDPAHFAVEAERLIVEQKVDVLFGCWASSCRRALAPVVERRRHLLFYPVQYEGLEQSPHIVYTGAAPNQQIIPGARWAIDHLGRRIYLVGSDYIFPRAAHRLIRDLVAAAGGQIVAERYRPLGDGDFTAIAQDIRRQAPDVVINTVNGDSNRHFFRALKAHGVSIPVMSFSIAENELRAMGSDGVYPAHYAVWSYFQTLDTPANARFVAAFQARFGADRVTSDPVEASYNGLRLWANAVRETGTTAPDQINRVIGRQSVPGPSGIVALDADTRHAWRWVRIGRARPDGQFETVRTSENLVRPVPFPAYRSREQWLELVDRLSAEAAP